MPPESNAPAATSWYVAERGSVLGIRFVAWLQSVVGLRGTSLFLWGLAWYYVWFSPGSRRASREYLGRVGEAPTLANVHRHFWTFAQVALHRLIFLSGDRSAFQIELHGHERIMGAGKIGTPGAPGALLLGAHLGSFEAMRALATEYRVPLTILVDFRNAAKISEVLRRLRAPGEAEVRMLQIDDANGGAIFGAKECIERGELVAILGDRVPAQSTRTTQADFLGAPASWPTGPYLLAHILRCPVYLVGALFSPPARYDIHCIPFADEVQLPRGAREAALASHAQRYADALAAWAHAYPYNWFNFFEFWSRRP